MKKKQDVSIWLKNIKEFIIETDEEKPKTILTLDKDGFSLLEGYRIKTTTV